MSQIVLDAEAFKALSSDTRLQILKALDARRLTVSELGRLLGLNKATVFEHLQQLAKADLVKKEDEGRKWVYYKLTWKGKNVLHPENVQFMLLLATATLSVGGLVAQLGRLFDWWGASVTSTPELEVPVDTRRAPQGGPDPQADAAMASPDSGSPGATPASPPATEELRLVDDGAPTPTATEPSLLEDPNLWLVVALVALLTAVALYAWRYRVERRRERAVVLARLAALPPDEEPT